MIRIEGSANTAQIERMLEKITNSRDEALLIPVKPKIWWLGGEQSLIQLIITWARISSKPTLFTHIKSDEDPTKQLEKMSKRMFGFVALMMAAEIRDRKNSDRSLRESAYEHCRQIAEKMHGPIAELDLGPKVFLIAVDHSTKAYIPWLYEPDATVGTRTSFVSLANDIFTKLDMFKHISRPPDFASQIGAILHELFKNTHEWSRTDSDNVPWRRSVRGLSAEIHFGDKMLSEEFTKDSPALKQYFDKIRSRSDQGKVAFVELSVFDSGIGLARRWLNRSSIDDLPITKERDACIQCLTKHHSSSSQFDKGMGLAEVMQTMSSVDGFLKIRTGRISIYRDFANHPRKADGEDVILNDFSTCGREVTELAPIFGTHFQLLIPLLP